MPRSVKEWIGKTDDSKAPPKVRQRIYDKSQGICHICQLEIKPTETWHLDHVLALIEGGENRERNLAPAHSHCNLKKGQEETKRKAKVNRTRRKHIGIKKTGPKIQGRGFEKVQKTQKIDKSAVDAAALSGQSELQRRMQG